MEIGVSLGQEPVSQSLLGRVYSSFTHSRAPLSRPNAKLLEHLRAQAVLLDQVGTAVLEGLVQVADTNAGLQRVVEMERRSVAVNRKFVELLARARISAIDVEDLAGLSCAIVKTVRFQRRVAHRVAMSGTTAVRADSLLRQVAAACTQIRAGVEALIDGNMPKGGALELAEMLRRAKDQCRNCVVGALRTDRPFTGVAEEMEFHRGVQEVLANLKLVGDRVARARLKNF